MRPSVARLAPRGADVHPKIVSERLGHANIGMTLDTYSHVTLQMQQGAADAFVALLKAS